MENYLKGMIGWKGERGYSAYDVAVQNGFAGTEKDWLASLGTAEYLSRVEEEITPTSAGTSFVISSNISKTDLVDVYLDGKKLAQDKYTINTDNDVITFDNQLDTGNTILISILKARTAELPIITTIGDTSTDDTVPSAKALNTIKKDLEQKIDYATNDIADLQYVSELKLNKESIKVITGSYMNVGIGETVIVDVNYPEGFNKSNTVILGKMVSSNNNYYDTINEDSTVNGFPIIKMIALTDGTIRVWLENTASNGTRNAYYKITLMNTEHEL